MWISLNIIRFLKTKTVLIFVMLLCLESEGQVLEWAKEYNSSCIGCKISIRTDNKGNIYGAGNFYSNLNFYDANIKYQKNYNHKSSIYFFKLNRNGTLIWAKKIGSDENDRVNQLAIDSEANIYLVGEFSDTVNFDSGYSNKTLVSYGYTDAFIAKYDSSGKFIWVNTLGSNSIEYGKTIDIDKDDNIYCTFSTSDNVLFYNDKKINYSPKPGDGTEFIFKYNTQGKIQWYKYFCGARGLYDFEIDNSGNLIFTGVYHDTFDIDPSQNEKLIFPIILDYEDDTYLSKFDSSGNFIWAKTLGGEGNVRGTSITIDKYNNIYLAGYFENQLTYNTNKVISGKYKINNQFISKFNTNGNFLWCYPVFSYTGFIILAVNSAGYLLAYGGNLENVELGLKENKYIADAEQTDIFLSQYDLNGNFKTAFELDSKDRDTPIDLYIDNRNNIYIVGNLEDTIDFDIGKDSFNLSRGTTFIAKYNPTYTIVDSIKECFGRSHTFPCGNSSKNKIIDTCSLKTYLGYDSTIITIRKDIYPDSSLTQEQNLFTATDTLCSYAWLNCHTNSIISGETSRFFKAKQNGSYALIVNKEGCLDTSACYPVEIDYQYFLPNSFTPNDDGLNDVFEPVGNGIQSYHLKIYNRWGQQLFSGSSNQPWSGHYKNFEAEKGIYYYTIEITSVFDKKSTQTGTVLLLR